MALKISKISIRRLSKIYQNWRFWFKKINHLATLSGSSDKMLKDRWRRVAAVIAFA
jgi:hypothetical protein